jgi:hypothetical protein
MSFIFHEKIGFNFPLEYAEIIGLTITGFLAIYILKRIKKEK